ncbi:MAG TPA: ABC transporter permease [Thermoprotei archaeon]|nr:ABC transporter permease [Thermoprotei archaeon]
MLDLINYLTQTFVLRAIVASILTSILSSLMGSFMIYRGLSFMASGVAHAALGGVAFSLLLSTYLLSSIDPIFGAILFGVMMALIVGYMGKTGETEKLETGIGVSFAMAMSLAVLFMSIIPPIYLPKIWGYLMGDIFLLTNEDLIQLFTITIITSAITTIFYKEFIYVSFDMEGAMVHGMNVKLYHYLMLILIALAIIFEVRSVGAILVYVIMVIPAATASMLLKDIKQAMIFIFLVSFLSQFIGIILAYFFPVSPSALAGLLTSTIFGFALIYRSKKK